MKNSNSRSSNTKTTNNKHLKQKNAKKTVPKTRKQTIEFPKDFEYRSIGII